MNTAAFDQSFFLLAITPEQFERVGVLLTTVIVFVYFILRGWKKYHRADSDAVTEIREDLKGTGRYPVSIHCPSCGSIEFSVAKHPEDRLVLVPDRICSKCGVRYRPPTPRYLSAVLIFIGIVMIGFIAGVTYFVLDRKLFNDNGMMLVIVIVGLVSGICFGVYLIVFGITKLVQSKRL